MSPARYQELRAAGPTITAKDHERLKDFRPRPTPIAEAVRSVYGPVQFPQLFLGRQKVPMLLRVIRAALGEHNPVYE